MGLIHRWYMPILLYGPGCIVLSWPTSSFSSHSNAFEHISKFTKKGFNQVENELEGNIDVVLKELGKGFDEMTFNSDVSNNPNALLLKEALELIQSFGVDTSFVCHPTSNEYDPYIPSCATNERNMHINYAMLRNLEITKESNVTVDTNDEEEERKGGYDLYVNLVMAFVCVTLAAIAAGLTMGLLSLDPLELHIKEKASSSKDEKEQSRLILPILKDHHRLLVTLLLLNSIANEALPLFLDALVPG